MPTIYKGNLRRKTRWNAEIAKIQEIKQKKKKRKQQKENTGAIYSSEVVGAGKVVSKLIHMNACSTMGLGAQKVLTGGSDILLARLLEADDQGAVHSRTTRATRGGFGDFGGLDKLSDAGRSGSGLREVMC